MEKKDYCGSIANQGAQVIKAPMQQQKTGQTKVKTGEDLRSGI